MRGITRGKRVIAGLFAGLLLTVSFALPAVAAEEMRIESITLSPVSKRYELKAGEAKTDELTIINDGKVAYDFIVYAKPYSVSSDDYNPDFATQATNADAYRWVEFPKVKHHLEAGETAKVAFTINVPKNATPGGHYGVIFAETQPENTSTGNAVVRKKRVGSIIYATVQGTYQTGGELSGSDVPFLQLDPPLRAALTVTNTGNSDFVSTVSFKVSDLFGSLKYEEKKEYPVLPQTARKMPLEWKTAPAFGLYKVDLTSSFLDQKHNTSTFVLLMPGWALGLIVLVVVGGIVYLVLRRRY